MNISFNSPNDTEKFFGNEYTVGDIVAHGLVSLFLLLPPFLLDCLALAVLLANKKTKAAVKVTLANVILSSLVNVCSLFWNIFWYVPRAIEEGRQPWSCAISRVLRFLGPTASFVSLTVYGVVIFLIIKKGVKSIKWPAIVVAAILPWLCGLVNSVIIFAPSYGYAPRENSKARCGSDTDKTSLYIHLGFSWVVVGFGSCVVTIAFIIATYCYIRRQSANMDVSLYQVLYKLAIFLTTSDIFLAVFQVTLPTFALLFNDDEGVLDLIWYYVPVCFYSLSMWSIPISIIVVYEPVCTFILGMLLCNCKCEKRSPEPTK